MISGNAELDSLDRQHRILGPRLVLLLIPLLFFLSLLQSLLDPLSLFLLRACKLGKVTFRSDEYKTRMDNAEGRHRAKYWEGVQTINICFVVGDRIGTLGLTGGPFDKPIYNADL